MNLRSQKPILICVDLQQGLLEEAYWGGNRNNKNAEEIASQIIAKWRKIDEHIIMAKPEKKTVTRTVAVPKTKIVKQQPQQQTTPKDTERTDFTAIRPQPPLPNQQDDRDKR